MSFPSMYMGMFRNPLELPRPLSEMCTLGDLEVRHTLTVERVIPNRVPSPDELDPVIAEREKDDDRR